MSSHVKINSEMLRFSHIVTSSGQKGHTVHWSKKRHLVLWPAVKLNINNFIITSCRRNNDRKQVYCTAPDKTQEKRAWAAQSSMQTCLGRAAEVKDRGEWLSWRASDVTE